MEKDILIQQLVSMKIQIDALGSQVEAALSLLVGQEGECKHPQEKRKPLSMGGKVWQCECGYIHQGGD